MDKIKKHILLVLMLGLILTITACEKTANITKISPQISSEKTQNHEATENISNASQERVNKETNKETSDELSNNSNATAETKDTQSNSYTDWEDAYKNVLLNPQKYEVRLMDSTTPDEGWNNLGFSILDLDGDNVPELLIYYNDGSNSSAADVLAFTNRGIQNIASIWAEGSFKAEKGSFVTIDNGGLYGSSYSYKFEKNKLGTYEKIKSFEYINDMGAEKEIYKEDEQDVSKDQFNVGRTSNNMDYSDDCIESAGTYHVRDIDLNADTSQEIMDGFWTK